MILRAFTDGASRGNPGEAGIGILVRDEKSETVLSLHGYIGVCTNNVAEYTAMETLLERASSLECARMIIHSDSELMVRQLNGRYRVKVPPVSLLGHAHPPGRKPGGRQAGEPGDR
jgi:ribonuclease HI